MTKITEHALGLLGDEQLIFSKLICSISMLSLLNPLLQAFSSVCYADAMVKYHRRKVRQPRRPTSSSSASSSSSSASESSSSASNFSSLNSSSSCSEVKKPTPRATIVVPSSLSRCHNSRVITATEYDPRDGTWVYTTTDKAVHNQNKAKAALLQNWNKFRHYSCKLLHCELCHEHQRSRRAGLMLDVIKTLPNPAVATRRSFTKSWTTYCRAHEQSSVQDTECHWFDCTCSFFSNCLFGAALVQSACRLNLCVLAMKRDAAQTSLPTDGDKEDAR